MPSELKFADVKRELIRHGWTLNRVNGLHHIFSKHGEPTLSIPVHKNRVKTCYASKIKKACGKA